MNVGQPDLSIKIIGHFNVGGGIFSYHTEYQLQVAAEGSTWVIYRRFNHFSNLHLKLLSILGEDEAKTVLQPLPDKSPLGSYFSTSDSFTTSRKAGLQNYLESLVQINDENVRREVLVFVDVDGKGLSGAVKEFGANSILKEAFAKSRQGSIANLWSITYVVLLKDGRLFIMKSMYDESAKAVSQWNLRGGEIRVVPKASNNMISITSLKEDKKLLLSLTSAAEAAFWIRSISDFSLMSNQQVISNVKEAAAVQREQAKQASQHVQTNQRTENIKAKGTGNTTDDLSSMYGI